MLVNTLQWAHRSIGGNDRHYWTTKVCPRKANAIALRLSIPSLKMSMYSLFIQLKRLHVMLSLRGLAIHCLRHTLGFIDGLSVAAYWTEGRLHVTATQSHSEKNGTLVVLWVCEPPHVLFSLKLQLFIMHFTIICNNITPRAQCLVFKTRLGICLCSNVSCCMLSSHNINEISCN